MLLTLRLLRYAAAVIVRQQRQIAMLDQMYHDVETAIDQLQAEVVVAELAYMRIGRDLIEQFLIALDKPEDHDIFRERLTVGLGFYRDEIAVREEHV